jgi:hypothetical protein
MGIFSSAPTTFVSSVVYNMAGDVNKRPDFLKSTVASAVIGGSDSIADSLQAAYLGGPGVKFKTFAHWADSSGYTSVVGITLGQITTGNSLDTTVLAVQIPHDAGLTVSVQTADLGPVDSRWWGADYISQHHPELFSTDWNASYDGTTVVITYADQTTESFVPVGLDINARYIYAAYRLTSGESDGAIVPGTPVPLGSGEAFPSMVGWTQDSLTTTLQPVVLNTTVLTETSYSDGSTGSSDTTSSPADSSYIETHGVYEKTVHHGIDPANTSRTYSTRSIQYQDQTGAVLPGVPVVTTRTDDMGGGVTRTTQTTTTTDVIVLTRTCRTDTQDITNNTFSPMKVFIYADGSGNPVLDAMFSPPVDMGKFFPYIPVRVDNRFISPTYQPDVYAAAKKAYRKAMASKFDDLVAKIADNPSLGDIDYAYVVFGVSLNVKDRKCKKYIYTFFQTILDLQSLSQGSYADWQVKWAAAKASHVAYAQWLQDNWGTGSDNVSTMPEVIPYPALPQQSVKIFSSETSNMNFNIWMFWNGIEQTSGAGMKSADHKVGDLWFEIGAPDIYEETYAAVGDTGVSPTTNASTVTRVTLYFQQTANNWKALTILGLWHRNLIYGGYSVDISAVEALNDTEESGFIIPLHETIYSDTSLADATQMATACSSIVFNCYQVVRKKWYQTAIFSIVMIIIIIVITIVTWGSGTGPAAAAYGAIGEAVGLTGTAAIIAGMAITMIASMVLMQIIGRVAKALFGDRIGAIVSTIATVVVMVVGAYEMGGGNWTTALNSLTSPSGILQLTSAITNGASQYLEAQSSDVIKQTTDMLNQYNDSMSQVSDLYAENIGTGLGQIDPLMLTDSAVGSLRQLPTLTLEPPSTFLNRTLMTGSDIAELTSTLITQYTSLTLDMNQNLVT